MKSLHRKEALSFYIAISPWLVGFLLFTAGPMAISLLTSFTDWDLLTDPLWVGLDNYRNLATDPLFIQSIKVTLAYTAAYVPLDLAGGLLLALLVRPQFRGIGVFRTIFYLPTVFSGVAFVVVWLWMLNPNGGLINLALGWFGIEGPRWLLDPKYSLWALVMMSFWGWGRSMALYLGGMQSIPGELYEAAAMDGAGSVRQFFAVTLPLLSPTIFFNLVLSVIATFQSFTSAFVATNGGPLDSTLFLVLYIYRQAFEFFHMGYAAALAWVLFAIVLVLTLLLLRSQKFWVFYLGERSK
ncbi:MAG TPA: sugar ABC transporter permease [Anaerolineaceae bacterium]|nr:sugar ABC transporter permease [Anaerolineaceae bacterium]HOH21491.1 sugar ABC transporter permease [Anaerolineaceae bacterium]HQP60415.1 sugar ABC transporter permease [Anaerolineaceae bacterium]